MTPFDPIAVISSINSLSTLTLLFNVNKPLFDLSSLHDDTMNIYALLILKHTHYVRIQNKCTKQIQK